MLVSVRPQLLTLNEFIKGTSPSFSWQYILPLLDQISSRTALEKRDHILDNPVAQEHFVRKGQVHRLMYSGARTSVVLNEKSNVILAKSSSYELNLGTTHATNERTSKELLNLFPSTGFKFVVNWEGFRNLLCQPVELETMSQ
jgi:hypothetical protein